MGTDWTPPRPPEGKKFQLWLMWGDVKGAFKVLRCSNTLVCLPKADEWLSQETVQKICDTPGWEVDVIGDQMWGLIGNFLSSKLPIP